MSWNKPSIILSLTSCGIPLITFGLFAGRDEYRKFGRDSGEPYPRDGDKEFG